MKKKQNNTTVFTSSHVFSSPWKIHSKLKQGLRLDLFHVRASMFWHPLASASGSKFAATFRFSLNTWLAASCNQCLRCSGQTFTNARVCAPPMDLNVEHSLLNSNHTWPYLICQGHASQIQIASCMNGGSGWLLTVTLRCLHRMLDKGRYRSRSLRPHPER